MNIKNWNNLKIGYHIEIIESKNKSLVGIKGKVIDETQNMWIIETEKGNKKILKNGTKIKEYWN
ncbi:ribonuclease P protein subunit [archaeon]|nr:ribonuclease P protein subunit [archaeon]